MSGEKEIWMLMSTFLLGCGGVKKATDATGSNGTFVAYNDKKIQYEGRTGQRADATELYWSGTTVRLRFEGTQVKAQLKDYNGQNHFNVIIDGEVVRRLKVDSTKKWYTLAENLAPAEHTVELFKRTQINKEYNRGYTKFYGFELGSGQALTAPPLKKRRIEFYGNSITCGHAVEDTTNTDSGASFFENNYVSYAAVTARHYAAQYSCIAVSGIGLMAGFRSFIMPEIYNLRNPFDSTDVWDFSVYQPQIVVVNLLQNDQAIVANPAHEQFKKRFKATPPTDDFIVNAYAGFVKQLRSRYPQASIVCVMGNMDVTKEGSTWPGYVEKAVAGLHDKKVYTHFFTYKGTPRHPNVQEQAAMATSLIQFIDDSIKW